jgi:hypothetical protein
VSRCTLRFGAKPGSFEVTVGPRDVDLVRQIPGLRHDHRTGLWRGKVRGARPFVSVPCSVRTLTWIPG